MAEVKLELDDKWYEVIATSPTAILTRHRVTGDVTVWKLDWRCWQNVPDAFEPVAWDYYLKAQQQ